MNSLLENITVNGKKYDIGNALIINDSNPEDCFSISDENGNVLCQFKNGNIYTKNNNLDKTERIVYNETLIGGGINSSGFTEMLYVSDKNSYYKIFRTKKFMRASKVLNITGISNDDVVVIYCYDDNMNFLKSVNISENVPLNTKWMGVTVSNIQKYNTFKNVSIFVESDVKTNTYATSKYSNVDNLQISFEVHNPIIEYTNGTEQANIINERHYDTGWIIIPPNYDYLGNSKVPLVIFCHGTGGCDPKNPSGRNYLSYLQFIAKCGYVVADCSGFTDKYIFSDDEFDRKAVSARNSRFTPYALSSYIALYKYIVECYNVKTDGVYIFGKSNGGLATSCLSILQPFHIRACGSLAGSLSVPMAMRYTKGASIQYWTNTFGMNDYIFNVDDSKYLYQVESLEDKQFIIDNFEKYRMFDGMSLMCSADSKKVIEKMFSHKYNTLTEDWSDVFEIVEKSVKIQPCPMKIWHAIDDVDVPINISRIYKKMIDNINGVCVLREFPAGVGAHHSVDTATNAPKCDYITPFGGEVKDIPVAYVELVEWFNKW